VCDDIEVVRATYRAYARGDFPAVLDALHPDIEVIVPQGWGPVAGVHRGHEDALAEFIERAEDRWEEFRVECDRFLQCDDLVIVLGHYRGRARAGRTLLATPFAHVWTMRAGQAVKVQLYTDTAALAQAAAGGGESEVAALP
jgi:ketosteroid isomerase-like protein